MKKFNINDYMYIQITDEGWTYLKKTVGTEYIQNCIDNKYYKRVIDGETWYRLQCHTIFDLLPVNVFGKLLFNINVMFDDDHLIDYANQPRVTKG